MERHQLGMDYYRRYPSIVNEVSREDILKTARKFIDVDRLAIAVAGP
jgi:predicted Zn-dependent peptidase